MKLKKEELEDFGLPFGHAQCPVILDEITDNSRWSIHHRVVFTWKDGKTYEAFYSVGATECQEERPWEYDDEVDISEVEEKEIMVKKWVRKGRT